MRRGAPRAVPLWRLCRREHAHRGPHLLYLLHPRREQLSPRGVGGRRHRLVVRCGVRGGDALVLQRATPQIIRRPDEHPVCGQSIQRAVHGGAWGRSHCAQRIPRRGFRPSGLRRCRGSDGSPHRDHA